MEFIQNLLTYFFIGGLLGALGVPYFLSIFLIMFIVWKVENFNS